MNRIPQDRLRICGRVAVECPVADPAGIMQRHRVPGRDAGAILGSVIDLPFRTMPATANLPACRLRLP